MKKVSALTRIVPWHVVVDCECREIQHIAVNSRMLVTLFNSDRQR